MIPPPSQNTATVCNQITLFILYDISPRQETLLNITDARIYVSDIFELTVGVKFINFSFQIFRPFIPDIFSSFTFYIVEIIDSALVWML
jgi:hypothetical protein